MITKENKLLVLLKYQPDLNMDDVNEYAKLYEYQYMYDDRHGIFNKQTKTLMSFIDFVDICKLEESKNDELWDDDDNYYENFCNDYPKRNQEDPMDFYDGSYN
jgi:hypothetical protein